MMITNLSLKNFKAFEDELFDFGPLNILSGLNNSGKSSVIQSLRLLNEKRPLPDLGPLIEYVRTDTKGFSLQCSQAGKPENITFSYDRDGEPVQAGFIDGLVSYISADRLGPRNSLPLAIDGSVTTVGSKGENIVDFLSLLDSSWGDDLQIPEALMATKGIGVNGNIKEWLRFISPGIDFEHDSDRHTDIGRTEFNRHRPVHVGFGLSYALPIIASVLIHASQLSAKKVNMVLLLIENPEAHLHPSGQTKMGEMLALASSCGVQIVVETHSDHLLNGVRIAVKEKKIRPEDVKCFFFKSEDREKPVTVNRISIDKHGMMDYWPEGFFDETEKSLMRLELQSIPLLGRFSEEQIEIKPSDFVLVRTSTTELRLKDILFKAQSSDRVKMQLLLQIFSHGQVIDSEALDGVENWIITNIGTAVPILEIAAKNSAIALTIPTEDVWRNDFLFFQNRTEKLHNLWGQTDITGIAEHCVNSLRNANERFSMRFNAIYCPGSLNDAPNITEWERFGYFKAMQKAKEREYRADDDLIKNKNMPKTKKYGSLLELRIYGPGHRIFFAHRKGLSPEILIGGFYQKNESMSQNDAIQNAKKRIDDYNDEDI